MVSSSPSLLCFFSLLCALPDFARAASWPLQTFKTVPFAATVVSYIRHGTTAPGYLFMSPTSPQTPEMNGAQLMTDDGQLVWKAPQMTPGVNFNLQEYNGDQYLTYWLGQLDPTYQLGYGGVAIVDNTYTQRYNICGDSLNLVSSPTLVPISPCKLDFHESRITQRNTLVATAHNITRADLRSVGGPANGWVIDNLFVEFDIPTGKPLLVWSALDHLDQLDFFNITRVGLHHGRDGKSANTAWDFFHINSIAEVPPESSSPGWVISSRFLSAIVKTDFTGNVEWYFSGVNGGNFSLPTHSHFAWQHDVVAYDVTSNALSLSIFDNANWLPSTSATSSGLSLRLNLDDFSSRYIERVTAPNKTVSTHTGSYQLLPNGNSLVDYGHPPIINEFSSSGELVYEASLANANGGCYRSYRYPFVGKPKTNPVAVANFDGDSNRTSVYMSWNGATEVAAWSVSTGTSRDDLMYAARTNKRNFETLLNIPGSSPYVRARALDSSNNIIGITSLVPVKGHT